MNICNGDCCVRSTRPWESKISRRKRVSSNSRNLMMWGYSLGVSVFRLFQIGVDVFLMSPGAPDPHQISTGSHPLSAYLYYSLVLSGGYPKAVQGCSQGSRSFLPHFVVLEVRTMFRNVILPQSTPAMPPRIPPPSHRHGAPSGMYIHFHAD